MIVFKDFSQTKFHSILIYSNIEVPIRCTYYRVYFYLTIALQVSGIIITHLQEHKTTVTTASGNRYTVIDRVLTVEEYL